MAWTFLQMQDKVLGWLDDTGDDDRMREMCKQVLNDAQLARTTEYPWAFMRKTATLTPLTAGSAVFALPADFYRPCSLQVPGTNQWMTEISMRGRQQLGPDPASTVATTVYGNIYGVSYPFYYDSTTVSGAARRAVVCADTGQVPTSITCIYYYYPTEMSANTDLSALPSPHEQLLVYDAVMDLKTYASESVDLIPLLARKRDEALARLYESQKGDQTLGAWGSYTHPQEY